MTTQRDICYQGIEEQYKRRNLPCPADIHEAVEQFFGIEDFLNDSYLPYLNEIEVRLHKLALQQFPAFQSFPDARADHWVRVTHCWYSGNNILFSAAELVREQADGLVPADTYRHELEGWRKRHRAAEGPKLITDDFRDPVTHVDDDAWEALKKKLNRKMRMEHEWNRRRKAAWHEIVSDALMKHYPAFTELEGDYWMVMAERFAFAHEVWKNDLADVERTIEYEMPLECVKLPRIEFAAELRKAIKRMGNAVSKRRDARIEADAVSGGYAEME